MDRQRPLQWDKRSSLHFVFISSFCLFPFPSSLSICLSLSSW